MPLLTDLMKLITDPMTDIGIDIVMTDEVTVIVVVRNGENWYC